MVGRVVDAAAAVTLVVVVEGLEDAWTTVDKGGLLMEDDAAVTDVAGPSCRPTEINPNKRSNLSVNC